MKAEQTLSFSEAVKFLPETEEIHTTVDAGWAVLGADWDRKKVLEEMERATEIRVSGPNAQASGHGLAIPYPADNKVWLFIQTSRNLLEIEGEQS